MSDRVIASYDTLWLKTELSYLPQKYVGIGSNGPVCQIFIVWEIHC